MSLSETRFGANAPGLPGHTPLPSLSAALSRRAALFGAVTVAGVTAAAAVPVVVQASAVSADAALIAEADTLKALRTREPRAWNDLPDDAPDDGPGSTVCHDLSADICAAGQALAEVAEVTPAGLAAKASAMLALVGRGCWTETEAFTEHHALVASVLRDAAGERGARSAISVQAATASADVRLGAIAAELTTLQAKADRMAAGAALDPADPYTLAAVEMAALPADTMGGVLTKLRAMAVPIVRDDDEAHGLALSLCRDLQRLQATGALS